MFLNLGQWTGHHGPIDLMGFSVMFGFWKEMEQVKIRSFKTRKSDKPSEAEYLMKLYN